MRRKATPPPKGGEGGEVDDVIGLVEGRQRRSDDGGEAEGGGVFRGGVCWSAMGGKERSLEGKDVEEMKWFQGGGRAQRSLRKAFFFFSMDISTKRKKKEEGGDGRGKGGREVLLPPPIRLATAEGERRLPFPLRLVSSIGFGGKRRGGRGWRGGEMGEKR